jgi:hypothetical protein
MVLFYGIFEPSSFLQNSIERVKKRQGTTSVVPQVRKLNGVIGGTTEQVAENHFQRVKKRQGTTLVVP